MAVGEGDVENLMSNGDFDTEAVFDGTIRVSGWFTAASQGMSMGGGFGQIEVEAAKPSFVGATSALTAVRNKMSAVIDGITYQVEKVEPTGVGMSVVWLKT